MYCHASCEIDDILAEIGLTTRDLYPSAPAVWAARRGNPQGTAFTERQARKIKQYCEEVVLCFDADLAGEKAAERSLAALKQEGRS